MSFVLRILHYALSHAKVYAAIMLLLGAKKGSEEYVSDFMCPQAGERVLDLGCGTARILEHLPEVNYVGADSNKSCIDYAREHYGDKGEFVLADVISLNPDELGKFDLVIATGLLHHLDDAAVEKLMEMISSLLKPTGRLITLDGCYEKFQNPVARLALNIDRGKFVRYREGYEHLVRKHIPNVKVSIVKNLLTIPYTHIIMECRPPEMKASDLKATGEQLQLVRT